MRDLDLSHTNATDENLAAVLERAPGLRALQIDFNSALTDASLDAIPPSVERVDALGCERFTFCRLQQLERELASPAVRPRPRAEKLRCDDSLVMGVGSARNGSTIAQSLFAMLLEYRAEEARRE